MRILITAGPTREYVDDVRFLSNPSSGRMGFACAQEARRRGHRVVLVCGPVDLPAPAGVVVDRVVTAGQMERAVRRRFGWADALIMAAAVSDYRPERRVRGKLKKTRTSMTLRLVRNPDIIGGLARRKGARIFAGFAVESRDLELHARAKMRRKGLDFIVANRPAAFGAGRVDALLLRPDGTRRVFDRANKRIVARAVVEELERVAARRGGWVPPAP